MAKKNKKQRTDGSVPLPKQRDDKEKPRTHPSHNGTRETFESLAIAFMLAFFIRTFVVEPFVIPTGSMSPALQGVHKDLRCPQCGERYLVNSAVQAQMRSQEPPDRCVGGMCPMCRYTMAYDEQLARQFDEAPAKSRDERGYSGDRIIVNKFLYSFTDPQRWDVVVFKYPGNATDNYIKRLVGLPEETLRIFGGDLYTKPQGADEFTIQRKPANVAYAMREPVHDNHRDPANLYEAGWPLRWQLADENSAWKSADETSGNLILRKYALEQDGEHWLRYVHTPPPNPVWPTLEAGGVLPPAEPHLVADFNSYNTRIMQGLVEDLRGRTEDPFLVMPTSQGVHWVGDLFVEADVRVQQAGGQLLLEVVEAGHRFRATIDTATGEATLGIVPHDQTEPLAEYQPKAKTSVRGLGRHRVMLGNVDDALYLWVDDRLVEFDQPTTYDWQALLGDRQQAIPQTSDDDLGDLAPAGVGGNDARLAIEQLRVYRDIYYIATRDSMAISRYEGIVADYLTPPPSDLLTNPSQWNFLKRRRQIEFVLDADQFFVMGDNSPQSSDARLWNQIASRFGTVSKPGGNYLERQLLIGRAISVVWPHPWHYVIPGFTDMRRIE